ncbi:protein ECERIFERUM 2 [Cucurbita maxima]|uniref:Protein ECERIFERUM 2 n=1 Tax=Cucurbita maxima TaxID=3661 RepID=A0A6J1IV89_CUCMA|nr:protein ECERIFERUM 2 [Cucurbita maxima]
MDGSGNDLISEVKFSSVVPAKATGENKVHELSAIDLAMKLHYIRGVYFFRPSEEVRNLTIYDLKKPMFPLLEIYYVVSGRIRRRIEDRDRPFIKCNDSGVRIVEVECEKTIDEWLSIDDDKISHRDGDLVYSRAIGPDLGFSPLVFIQLTRFRCGGLSVGLSWAHVLGDIFSASTFINAWGHVMKNRPVERLRPLPATAADLIRPSGSTGRSTSPIKRLDSTGDLWIASNDCKMAKRSFRIMEEQLVRILSVVDRNRSANYSSFEAIAAIFWKCLSKIRLEDSDSKTISIYSTKCPDREGQIPRNGMVMSAVEADFPVAGAEEGALAELIVKKKIDEDEEIKELVEKEREESDFIAYGARLTFVDLEEANLYGLELEGQRPVHVNYEIGGVGENGVVLVLPGPPRCDGTPGGGRTVTVILPEKQLPDLIDELQKQWAIV